MIEELLPELCQQDADSLAVPALPALRRVILLDDTATAGALRWEALLEGGQGVSAAEVTRRCAATDG
jgi:hypothetical protein